MVFLAYTYSAPPLRLKSRSWLAVIALLIVLSILPILFVYHTFSSKLNPFFLLFLSGQALTVYSVIIPAEIRDYWGDKALGIETMTVKLGLVKASLFALILLSTGGILCGTGLFLKLASGTYPALTVLLLIMVVAYYNILRKYKPLKRNSFDTNSGKMSWCLPSLQTTNGLKGEVLTLKYSPENPLFPGQQDQEP